MKYTLLLLLIPGVMRAQDFNTYVQEYAVETPVLDSLSDEVYRVFENDKLILVGEMHGTREPAELVWGLARLMSRHEGEVSVGVEVPSRLMNSSEGLDTPEALLKTNFFQKENTDGRNGQAWFDLMLKCSQDSTVHLFFFDSNEATALHRDSIMYRNVKAQHETFPKAKVITLSGNVHNHLIPFRGEKKMGAYCLADTEWIKPHEVSSINHYYQEGTMLNATGGGLNLQVIEPTPNIYAEASEFEQYLLPYATSDSNPYNCSFYTQKVTHSAHIQTK